MNRFNNFDRRFRIHQAMIGVTFVIAFLLILAIFGAVIYTIVTIVSAGPAGVGQFVGEIVRGFNETVNR